MEDLFSLLSVWHDSSLHNGHDNAIGSHSPQLADDARWESYQGPDSRQIHHHADPGQSLATAHGVRHDVAESQPQIGFADPLGLLEPPPLHWDPAHFDGLGTPVQDATHWHHQHSNASCAVVAQAGIYESLTGHPLSEDAACHMAQQNGIFDPDTGTRPQDMGKLLDILGVPTETHWNASPADLVDALERGDKVMVAVNANEIWHPVHENSGTVVSQRPAGHAIWVTGIERAPDGSYCVILNDSGTPNGQGEAVALMDFQHAWQEFGGEMVVAHAPPAVNPAATLGTHDWVPVAHSGYLYERVNGEYTGNYTKS